jgi:hypothetical protein
MFGSSAAQPAARRGRWYNEFGSSAAQPAARRGWRKLAFYNVGWNKASTKHSMERLAEEVMAIVHAKGVDAMGISEVFNLKDDDMHEARQEIMQHLLLAMNGSAEQPAWAARSDGHYIFLWNTNKLFLNDYEVVTCGIVEHPWRKAQYLQFQNPDLPEGPPLHICHCHSPSSDANALTLARRKRTFSALWTHVLRKDSAWPAQPAAVFGGDFNNTMLQWTQCFKDAMNTQASRRTVQVCTSKTIPCHHGDRAIAINVNALQEDSGWGKSHKRSKDLSPAFSDAHDVVLVPLFWGGMRTDSSAARPVSSTISDIASMSSHALPALPPGQPQPKPSSAARAHSTGSAALPATPTDSSVAQPALSNTSDFPPLPRTDRPVLRAQEPQLKPSPASDSHSNSNNATLPAARTESNATHVDIAPAPRASTAQPAPSATIDLVSTRTDISVAQPALPNTSDFPPVPRPDRPVPRAEEPQLNPSAPPDSYSNSGNATLPAARTESNATRMDVAAAPHAGIAAPSAAIDLVSEELYDDTASEAPSLAIPSIATPLYKAFLEKMEATGDDAMMENLANFCLFGPLRNKAPSGSAEPPAEYNAGLPYSLGMRIENLLTKTNEQRQKHIARLASRNDPRANHGNELVFNDDDMKELLNNWRHEPETWMTQDTLTTLQNLPTQKKHQTTKSAFSTMQFQLFGNISLTQTFIRFPISSAARPASFLEGFLEAWQKYLESPTSHKAREDSKPQEGKTRLSKQIYHLKEKRKRGKWVADWVAQDWNNWYQLSAADKTLLQQYQNADIDREIRELEAQQQPRFPGATSFILSTGALPA